MRTIKNILIFAALTLLSFNSYGLDSASAPTKQQIPFAESAGGAYKRTVPVASQIGIQDGAASYTDGFPPLNFTPVSAGGVPPFGQDMNGIFNATTALTRWYSAGGPILYDGTYQTAIGGYPLGAIVQSATTVGRLWVSTTENNVTNPDTGGAGWQYINDAANATNATTCLNLSGGTVNAAASSGSAITGTGSGSTIGVYGNSTSSYGVYGQSGTAQGVLGVSTSGYGVFGNTTSGVGVYGQSTSGAGVRASSATGPSLTILPDLVAPTTGVEAGSIYITVNSGVSATLHIYDGSTWRSTTLTTTP